MQVTKPRTRILAHPVVLHVSRRFLLAPVYFLCFMQFLTSILTVVTTASITTRHASHQETPTS
ncbi:hypothetical protein BDN71DRAFT_1438757 [Pleurotus eryngii]|uniref:Uncharacterized protein n=1 Tax=Pleurotus eryngii TaxID=5323 RepID=A0A9P6A9C5_PLEER|nr:hypothetical protein BDN71DRAFT_1438757 [Pleurotus eryngii]